MKINSEKIKRILTYIQDTGFIIYNILEAFIAKVIMFLSKVYRFLSIKFVNLYRYLVNSIDEHRFNISNNIKQDNKEKRTGLDLKVKLNNIKENFIQKVNNTKLLNDKIKIEKLPTKLIILYILILVVLALTNNAECRLIDDNNKLINIFEDRINSNTVYVEPSKTKVSIKNNISKNKDFYLDILDEGKDIFYPTSSLGYRKDASIIKNDNDSYDIYYSGKVKDNTFISYQHYENESLSNEKIVLWPTKYTDDEISISCPSIIYYDGYYYLAYIGKSQSENGLFLARSNNPNGPFKKWDNENYNGIPKAFIKGDITSVSLHIVEGKIYCFYCLNNEQVKVAIYELKDNWPNLLIEDKEIFKLNKNCESFKVSYLKDKNCFIAYSINNPLSDNSNITLYLANNNLKFKKMNSYTNNLTAYASKVAIANDKYGRINMNQESLLIYGYSDKNLVDDNYATRMHLIKFVEYDDMSNHNNNASIIRDVLSSNTSDNLIGISNINKNTTVNMGTICYLENVYYDQAFNTHKLVNVDYSFDEDYVSIIGNTLFPIKEGETLIRISSDFNYADFIIKIVETEEE